ncbi:MAG: carbohydrate binding family 9 domain-containing protein, partial [Planctomycetes bacterium]|nr:carbohydrate binding family 9 domain-containing protein [Planctomycetota bacterium]
MHVPRAAAPIVIDGVLDEAAWASAAVIPVNIEFRPGDNAPAPVDTTCLLTHDDRALYAAFRAADPRPAEIRAHLSARDGAYRDDNVGILLDTFNDQRRGFEFFVNPLGVQMDLAVSDIATGGENEDDSWDAIWASAGRITADGYVVEIAIPFSTLRFADGAGDKLWGFAAARNQPRSVRAGYAS